jgi:chloramphenicol-sensitive protein RarD
LSHPAAKVLDDRLVGYCYALAAFVAWGVLPLYWKMLEVVPAQEILAHRVVWSFLFMAGILITLKSWSNLIELFKSGKNLAMIAFCAVLISINWYVYIWAVNTDRVVEASMGYYITPIITFLFGITLLKERLYLFRFVAFVLVVAGVALITVYFGRIPWIALVLASTFAVYSLLKKLLKVDSALGLALETAFITPLALAFIMFKQFNGTGSFAAFSPVITLFLVGSGIVTAIPLLWFAKAAQKIELSSLGILQYIGPSISLLIGIFYLKEAFTAIHFISFCLIWAGVIVYSWSAVNGMKKMPAIQKQGS